MDKAMLREVIPDHFWRGNTSPKAHTVGQLRRLLSELPDDLSVQCELEGYVTVTVVNVGDDDLDLEPHVMLSGDW
jgi:hypothetical protein